MSIHLRRARREALAAQVDARVHASAGRTRAGEIHRTVQLALATLSTVAVFAMATAAVNAAVATSLGGVAGGKLFTQTLVGPSLGVVDTFVGTSGSTLAGRLADTGQKWTVSRSTFALNATGTALASTSGTALATAWAPAALTAYTAQVDLTRASTTATSGGLYLNVDSTGLVGLVVIWQPGGGTGQIVVGKITGGSSITVLDTHVGAGVPAVGTAVTLKVVCNGSGSYTISYGAFGPYTVALGASDVATIASKTNVGIVSDRNNKNLFDNFLAKP